MKTCRSTHFIFLLLCVGCSRAITNAPPESTPERNFEYLWQEYERLYPSFELKGVDWDSVYAVYRPQITPQTTDKELFLAMSRMLATLQDGHVSLNTPMEYYSYTAWWDQYPSNYDRGILRTHYLGGDMNGTNSPITYRLLDEQIGYVYIDNFVGTNWGGRIEIALKRMEPIKGLIVDVRNNGGGNERNAGDIAGRFTRQKRLYQHIQWRNGPNRNDLASLQAYLEPKGNVKFTKPTVVLTNRRVFSSAEAFVLMMRTLPHVTVVGDATGGGSSGFSVLRELPNGWIFRVPAALSSAPNFEPHYEGNGLAPDVWVSTPDDLLASGTDRIFETAVDILRKK